jgi:hypothetical protein
LQNRRANQAIIEAGKDNDIAGIAGIAVMPRRSYC